EAAYSLLLPWGWMLGLGPIAGFGFGLTEAVLGAIIIEFVAEGKASAMTRLETFFGLGALAMPAIAGLLIANHVWQMAFPVVTAVSGIATLLWLTVSFGKVDDLLAYDPLARRQAGQAGSVAPAKPRYARASLPVLVIGILYFALYVGMEMSFSNYLPSILKERMGMEEAAAAWS